MLTRRDVARSSKDAVVEIDMAQSSAFFVRQAEVCVRAEHFCMLPVYFVPVQRGKTRGELAIRCHHLAFDRSIYLSAKAL